MAEPGAEDSGQEGWRGAAWVAGTFGRRSKPVKGRNVACYDVLEMDAVWLYPGTEVECLGS